MESVGRATLYVLGAFTPHTLVREMVFLVPVNKKAAALCQPNEDSRKIHEFSKSKICCLRSDYRSREYR
jgi:hypothetical protein